MSPRYHFAEYMKNDPKGYQTFSDNLWNTFVGVTHTIGLGAFFTFSPDFYPAPAKGERITGQFEPGEIPGDQETNQ